jgi:uncharacterized protein
MKRHTKITRRSAITRVLTAGAAGWTATAKAAAQTAKPLDDAGNPQILAFEERLIQARPLPLANVRLTGGPLKAAQDADIKYLLELQPDRMLAYYRRVAGLQSKAEPYTGWDGGGRNLTGHIAGHYLSAVSLMFAATGDGRFKERVDYIVGELKDVQDAQIAKHGDGYLGALEKGRECFEAVARGEIRSGGFDLNGQWSPWYTLHKTYAGLRDAYRFAGNRTALDLEIKYAQWAAGVVGKLSDPQIQRMLNTEFGGMNEVLADLYADTGDARWLALSRQFELRTFVDPLRRHQDNLGGRHGNTVIPQMIGAAARHSYTGDAGDLMAASFFWDRVVQHHSYSTGGHGLEEYFGEPDKLADRVDGRTCESCNIYNMLKLTRRLFALQPDAHYADFQERALFNHVLGSIDPADGSTCYMVPVGRGVRHEYQSMMRDFTCCVGSGMENHALHGHGIYYEAGDRLWVNLYAPSTAEWSAAGLRLETETDFPVGESAKVRLTLRAPKEFALLLRRPYWAGDAFAVKVNGEAQSDDVLDPIRADQARARQASGRPAPPTAPPPWLSTFVQLKRTWKTGDVVEVSLPKTLRLEPTPDNPHVASIMWGPLVMAGDLGAEPQRGQGQGQGQGDPRPSAARARLPKAPVLLAAALPPPEWLKAVEGQNGQFRTDGVVRVPGQSGVGADVDLRPFYQVPRRTYALYWDFFTPSEWESKQAAYAAEQERQRKLEAATVAFAQPGEMQPERDFNYQGGDGARVERVNGVPGRAAGTWFSFDLPVDASAPMALVVTYYSSERQRASSTFEIQVDGKKIADQTVERGTQQRFYETEYAIPADVVHGKSKVTVRFKAAAGSTVATVFGVRMIRADAPR